MFVEEITYRTAEQLIRYYYIYKHGAYQKAVDNYHEGINVKTIKSSLNALQDLLNDELVIYNKKTHQLEFTCIGDKLGRFALGFIENLSSFIGGLDSYNTRDIHLGVSSDFYRYYLRDLFIDYMEKNSDINLKIELGNQFHVEEDLINKKIDLIVGTTPVNPNPLFEYIEFDFVSIYLVVLKSRSDEFKSVASLNELSLFSGATVDSNEPFHSNILKSARASKIRLNIRHQISDVKMLYEFVKRGFVDYTLVGNYYRDDMLSYIDVTHLFEPVRLAFIVRSDERIPDSVEKIIKYAQSINIKPRDLLKQ